MAKLIYFKYSIQKVKNNNSNIIQNLVNLSNNFFSIIEGRLVRRIIPIYCLTTSKVNYNIVIIVTGKTQRFIPKNY